MALIPQLPITTPKHNSVQNISRLGAGARLRKDFEMRLRKFMVRLDLSAYNCGGWQIRDMD